MDFNEKMGFNETLSYWWFCLANNIHLKFGISSLPDGETASEASKAHNRLIKSFTLKALRNGWKGAIMRSIRPISWSQEANRILLSSGDSDMVVFIIRSFLEDKIPLRVSEFKHIAIDKRTNFGILSDEEINRFKQSLIAEVTHAENIPKEYLKLFYLEHKCGEKNSSIARSLLGIFASDNEFIKYLAMNSSSIEIAKRFFSFASSNEVDAYIRHTNCLYCFDGLCSLEELLRNRKDISENENIGALEALLLDKGGTNQIVAYIKEYGLLNISLPALIKRKIMSEIDAYNHYREKGPEKH